MKEIPKGYKSAGVDIITGDKASKIMFEASKLTWKNRFENNLKIELLQKSFSGNRFIDLNNFPDAIIGMNFDGVGTKIEIAERVGRHDSVAFDLFAMVCDDAAILGGEPILLGSIIDFNKISLKVVRELARGMVQAARLSNVAVINGEIAELGSRVNGFGECSYNWGASTIWVGRRERMLRRGLLDPNAVIVATPASLKVTNGPLAQIYAHTTDPIRFPIYTQIHRLMTCAQVILWMNAAIGASIASPVKSSAPVRTVMISPTGNTAPRINCAIPADAKPPGTAPAVICAAE